MTDQTIKDSTQPVVAVRPAQEARSGGGLGCWLTGIVTMLVVVALVVVGLLLPPFNLADRLFGPQYAMLSPEANAIGTGDLTVIADAGDVGSEFGVLLDETPLTQFTAADASAPAWVRTASGALPLNSALQSSVYSIETTGSAPQSLNLNLTIPANTNGDLLDMYAWDSGSNRWEYIPAQQVGGALYATVSDVPEHVALFQAAPPEQPRVLVAVDVTQELSDSAATLANIVAPGGLQPTLDGKLTGSLAPGFDLNASYQVMPILRNFVDPRALDTQTVGTILSNSTLRRQHAAEIAAFASAGYDGVIIDYRELPAEQRDNLSALMRDLGAQLDAIGLQLGVVVPAAQNTSGVWDTGAYDWRALGEAVDIMEINLSSDPSIFASADGQPVLVDAMLRWAVGEVSRQKLVLGVSALSARQTGNEFVSVGYDEALSALGDVEIETDVTEAGTILPGTLIEARLTGFRAEAATLADTPLAYIDYYDESDSPVARMWLGTPDSLRYRMDATIPFALSGIGFDDLLASDLAPGVLDTILNYKLNMPAMPAPQELALRWTIEGTDGILGEVTTGLNESLAATITAPDGNYAVNVDIIASGGSAASARGGASVLVFAPTPTPTPLPTSTPTPTPAPTATRVPQAVAAAPAGGGVAAAPAAGSIAVGNFEYGGHVTNTNTGAAGAMQSAGMNWMKIQIRYTPGTSPGVAAEQISAAHGRGFKILLGLVGNPGDLAAGGAGYVQQFASFAGGVAALGPDGIEIWNEANIDREWPRNQISGAAYADMLRQAHAAIKGANGGVMVISAAPAPTGAEAAFPGQVVNDDNWMRQFVEAGGLNYTDCVGVHYNEGVVSPTQTSGDPRDNYYTRYFRGMLDTYWNITGGQRPLCFTELGFLTPEGYPPLDPYFAWGANTSVSQQAAWLAEAAAIASQSGRVRLMIIWNIDFSNYGADPMAGFAIIRPGGGCPACNALAGAR
jgi:hypothetical protein